MTDLHVECRASRAALGRRIRELRHRNELSQEVLAERAGIHRTYVSDLEGGRRNVTLDNILKLAEAFGVHPGHLFPADGSAR